MPEAARPTERAEPESDVEATRDIGMPGPRPTRSQHAEQHLHRTHDPTCYRCDLSADEVRHAPSGEPEEEAKWRQRSLTVLELAQENERLKQEAIERGISASDQVEAIDALRADLAQRTAELERLEQERAALEHTLKFCAEDHARIDAELQQTRAVVRAAQKWVASEKASLQDAELSARELYAAVRALDATPAVGERES